jgi:hypothetical protein
VSWDTQRESKPMRTFQPSFEMRARLTSFILLIPNPPRALGVQIEFQDLTEIRNVRKFNQALLEKWLWRYAHEEGSWWRSVLVAKYRFSCGGWRSSDITESQGVGFWKYICMGWRNFKCHFRFDPGIGSKVSFWENVWCGESALKDTFSGLFSTTSFIEASTADNVEHSNSAV